MWPTSIRSISHSPAPPPPVYPHVCAGAAETTRLSHEFPHGCAACDDRGSAPTFESTFHTEEEKPMDDVESVAAEKTPTADTTAADQYEQQLEASRELFDRRPSVATLFREPLSAVTL